MLAGVEGRASRHREVTANGPDRRNPAGAVQRGRNVRRMTDAHTLSFRCAAPLIAMLHFVEQRLQSTPIMPPIKPENANRRAPTGGRRYIAPLPSPA